MTVTPVLADQLEAEGVAERLLEFLRRFRVGSCERDAADVDGALRAACLAEAERYRRALDRLEALDGDLLELFAGPAAGRAHRADRLGGHATPCCRCSPPAPAAGCRSTPGCARTGAGSASRPASGCPECAYEPGLERLLAERGLRLLLHRPERRTRSPGAALAPIATAGRAAGAAPIDWEAVSWVWVADGYPADPAYRRLPPQVVARRAPVGDRAASPTTRPRPSARARARAGEFAAGVAERLRVHARAPDGRGLVVFASTPSCSGTGGGRGRSGSASCCACCPSTGSRR